MALLDAHEVVKEPRAAGFTDTQAEAVTRLVRRSQEVGLSDLVTRAEFQLAMALSKSDLRSGLAEVRSEMQSGFAEVRSEMQSGIAEVRSDMQSGIAEVRSDMQKGLADARSDTQKGLDAVRRELAETKAEIMKWVLSSMGVQTVVVLGTLITLMR